MYPFTVKVYATRRPWMRDPNLEYLFMLGRGILDQIFDHEKVSDVETAVFYYPERYLNIVEERSLFSRLQTYCPKLKSVEIVTQSVYIMQCTPGGSLKILISKDEEGNGLTNESPTGRLWRNNSHDYDFSKLNVL